MEDAALAERIVGHIRGLGIDLPVLVRSMQGRDEEALIEAGATVFPEGLESSLSFAGQLLIMLDIPPSRVEARLSAIRAEDYAPLRAFWQTRNGLARGGHPRNQGGSARLVRKAEKPNARGTSIVE